MNTRLNSFYDPRPNQVVSAMEAFLGESVKFSEAALATQRAELNEGGIEKEANMINAKVMVDYCRKGEFLRRLFSRTK
jgi:hypothetical protein